MDIVVKGDRCIDYEGESYPQGRTIRGVSKKEALRLIGLEHAVAAVEDDDGVIAETKAPRAMTVPELKELLDKLEVEYPADAKKPALVALVEKNTAEPPEE